MIKIFKFGALCLVAIFGLILLGGLILFLQNRQPHKINPYNICINNLRQIDAAANQFALEHNLTNGDRINFPNDLTPYLKLDSAGKIPPCPAGGIYSINKVGETPTCSIGTNVAPSHALQ